MLVLCTQSVELRSQDERAKVAQSYEQSGDYRSAARLWQSVYAESPQNDVAFYGVVRCLKALNNYSALLEIVQERVKRKKSAKVLIIWGQVLAKNSRLEEARDAWKEVMSSDDASPILYQELAKAQLEIQLVDRAIATYVSARSKFDDNVLFADELAQIYAAQGDYRNGIREVIAAFTHTASLQQTQGRLSAFMQSDSATQYIREHMASLASSNEDQPSFLRLYEWFLREVKDYNSAFEVVQRIDKLQNSKGRDILMFAEQCRYDGLHEIATKAYSLLIDRYRSGDVAQASAFGYAASMEARFRSGGELSNADVEAVIKLYRELINNFPRSTTAADAQLRIARCTAQYLKDLQRAIVEYRLLMSQYSMFPQAASGAIELGACHIAVDDLEAAERLYTQVLASNTVSRNPRIAQAAIFALGELHFFRCQFDSALTCYNRIEQTLESEYANDAIERMTSIGLNKSDTALLSSFAKASLRSTQQRMEEALKLFSDLASQRKNADLAELATMKVAEIQLQRREYGAVHQALLSLVKINPETIYADRAIFLEAETFQSEGKKDEALQSYQDLLAKFPRSLYVQEARERIRKLRVGL